MDGSTDGAQMYSPAFRTKMRIARATNELCREGRYPKVHVNGIVQRAGISRSSFYHHFSNKHDIVNWISLLFYERGLDQTGRTLTWFEGHMVTTKGFIQFAPLFTGAAQEPEYDAPQPFYVRHRQMTLTETLVEYKHLALTERLSFQIEALPYAEKVMANNYQRGSYACSLKEYCEHMVSLVPRDLFEALAAPVDPRPYNDFLLP